MSRRTKVAIVIGFLVVAITLIGVNLYLYHFYSTHAAQHLNPATGNIYEVGMSGTTLFLTRGQNILFVGTECGSLAAFGLAAYLSTRWKLGTPRSII